MILIVDDQTMTAALAQVMLARHGVASTITHNGIQALDWLDRHKVQVVLCDLSMPDMDGPSVVREIHNRWGETRPKVIAYSAYPPEEGATLLLEAGFDDFLEKPARADQLAALVRKWMN